MNHKTKIPFKWKFRWFCQGILSIFGYTLTAEERLEEVKKCVDEIELNELKNGTHR